MTTSPDFEGLLAALMTGGVPHVVAGGYSAMLHGSSLMTRDLDIVCPMDSTSVVSLYEALRTLHPVHRMTPDRPPFTRQQAEEKTFQNIYLGTDFGILDCLGEVRGIGNYDACVARSVEVDLGTVKCRMLDLDALIDAKRAMGRPRDLLTADELDIIRHKKGE